MELQILFGVFYALLGSELFAIAILLIPCGTPCKLRTIEWMDRQSWLGFFRYVFLTMSGAIFFLLFEFGLDLKHGYAELQTAQQQPNVHILPALTERILRAERNAAIFSFTLLLALLVYSYYHLLKKNSKLEKSLIAMTKQATQASQAYLSAMDKCVL